MKNILIFCLASFLFITCSTKESNSNYKASFQSSQVYRTAMNDSSGKKVFIVDGMMIRKNIYPEFLFGGNGERYLFVPANEIWIDNAIAVTEYKYTLAHELNERNLMAKKGWSYADAHDSSLALEIKMRKDDEQLSLNHEKSLHKVSPTDCDNLKEIKTLPDSIQLKNIYRSYLGERKGTEIWIVNGSIIRQNIFPDFGFSGNDLAHHFIPKNEIWIDSELSCEELEFAITSELTEREQMAHGKSYDDAYITALKKVDEQRNSSAKIISGHTALVLPKQLDRDTGTGSEK